MSVRIEFTQERSVVEGPLFRVTTVTTYTRGIDKNTYVFNTETQVFEHVASVFDMENYPNSRDTAIQDGAPYYRNYSVTVDYESETLAADAAVYTRQRLQTLANQYTVMSDGFVGTDSYVYTGE